MTAINDDEQASAQAPKKTATKKSTATAKKSTAKKQSSATGSTAKSGTTKKTSAKSEPAVKADEAKSRTEENSGQPAKKASTSKKTTASAKSKTSSTGKAASSRKKNPNEAQLPSDISAATASTDDNKSSTGSKDTSSSNKSAASSKNKTSQVQGEAKSDEDKGTASKRGGRSKKAVDTQGQPPAEQAAEKTSAAPTEQAHASSQIPTATEQADGASKDAEQSAKSGGRRSASTGKAKGTAGRTRTASKKMTGPGHEVVAAEQPIREQTQPTVASQETAPAETEAVSVEGDAPQAKRTRRGSRGGSAARKAKAAAKAKEAATTSEASADAQPKEEAPADFPVNFDDVNTTEAFGPVDTPVQETAEEGGEDEPSEKKRRGRTRRGGRGRKKSGQSATNGDARQAAPEEADAELEKVEVSEKIETKDKDREARNESAPVKGRRKMFVSVLPEEQVEVVITEEGQVQEYYVEMLHQAKTKGNIYKGIIHNVDPNLQAAFVSYGAVKNGFLQIDEVHPEYYVAPHEPAKGRKYPAIQKVLRPGQEVLVQVVKEPAGTKGAFLTTYLSLPGRFLVLTPGREQIGVSRKVDNETERSRLRELLEGLSPGPGLGVIVRTVSMGASKTNLQRDMQFLKRTWKDVRARGTTEKAPCLIYQEQELTARAIRDYLTEAVGEVWIDDEDTAAAVTEVAEALFPRKQNLVRVHKEGTTTLFERFNLQRQLDQIQSRDVSLPSGGRLVIDPTEALTAIDINSGRSSGKTNFEDMAFRTNLEAAKMIPLQLRLRDIGGQVVVDFIEMRDKAHWREVEKALRQGMKVDRARYDVGKIGPFGLLEIVRQRLGSSAISISTEPCPCCNGTGLRRNMEWRSQHALRDIQRALRSAREQEQTVAYYPAEQALALHLLNHKRQRLFEMEKAYGVRLEVQIQPAEVI